METNSTIFNKDKLYELEAARVVKPLEDLYLLEDAAMNIKEIDKKINFYKDYKNKKNEDIDREIDSLKDKNAFYRSIMVATLDDKNEKSVSFPGSCKISKRKSPDRWIIADEEAFREAIKWDPEEDKILQEVTQYLIPKKEVCKILNIWE